MPFVSCSKFNQSQATQDQAIADLAQELLNKQNALNDCSGKPLAGTVPTCAQMTTAIQTAISALPADKFLQGLQSYNPTTNIMTLLMSDGSTVPVDMTGLIADAVAGIVFPEVPKGLDCEAVGKLPERTYKAGDSVMVHGTDGLCARVVAKPGIFTDVRVGVVARSGSVLPIRALTLSPRFKT